MKLLSPSSSSSSVASTSTSYEAATGSCLLGMLRRIFCSNSLPEFPLGYAHAEVKEFGSKEEEFGAKAASPVPGILARLMGLETLPPSTKIPGERSPASISRSPSMNDVDCREKCEVDGDPRNSIKPAPSFRETPIYLGIENEEFLVLIFENSTETEGRGHCSDIGKMKRKKRRRNRTSILKNNESSPPRENSVAEHNPKSAEMSSPAKLRNVTTDQQEVVTAAKQGEIECGSENSSSPVSVLEFGDFITSDLGKSTSDEWRMEKEKSDDPKERSDGNLLEEQSMRLNSGSRRRDIPKQGGQIPVSSWERMSYEEGWMDMSAEIGSQIWEEMMDDLIVQLSRKK